MEEIPELSELIDRYCRWRKVYSVAGRPAWDEPVREARRLNFRVGYPLPGWTAYVIELTDGGFDLISVTTERRNDPHEGLVGFFSNADDAGKYIIWNLGDDLRVDCHVTPLTWSWRSAGLDPRVAWTSVDKYESRYEMKDDPKRYCILRTGGIQPEGRLLPLTYDELDAALLDGMPQSIASRL